MKKWKVKLLVGDGGGVNIYNYTNIHDLIFNNLANELQGKYYHDQCVTVYYWLVDEEGNIDTAPKEE